jgi:hypothetical protein
MKEQEETVRFGLRLPKPLYEYLTNKAMENNRSINSEIIVRLNPKVTARFNTQVHAALRLIIEAYIRLLSESKNQSHHNELVDKLEKYMGEGSQEVLDEWASRDFKKFLAEDGLE